MTNNLKMLLEKVIEPDYCIGCGVCASVENSPLKMKFTEDGMYRPVLQKDANPDLLDTNLMEICPFSNDSKNETEIGEELFNGSDIHFNRYNGYYLKNFAGHVKVDDYRERGASGGMASWIASKLLELKLVDAIIHVKPGDSSKSDKMYQYDMSNNIDELKMGAKSKYYPIELSQIIKKIKDTDKTYAVIGIPCFIKSLRLLSNNDSVIKQKIKYHIGLVCGHLKSSFFAESMAWEMGVNPQDLKHFDFRKKFEDKPANQYGVEATEISEGKERKVVSSTKELYSTNWGQGFFKYNACEYCDDVLSETADITIGDAWLPEYSDRSGGTNVVVVRDKEILEIIENNFDELELDEITAERTYESQAGGFRHRRDGLAYRLYLKDMNNEYRPQKRVSSSNSLKKKRKLVYEERLKLKDESFVNFHIAKNKNDFQEFKRNMDPTVKDYKKLIAPSFPKKVYNKLKRMIKE